MTFKILPKWRNFAKSAHTCCLLPTFCISVFLFFRLFRLFPHVLYLSLSLLISVTRFGDICNFGRSLQVLAIFEGLFSIWQHLELFLGKNYAFGRIFIDVIDQKYWKRTIVPSGHSAQPHSPFACFRESHAHPIR